MSRQGHEALVRKCDKALATDPSDARTLRQRADAKRKLGNHRDAIADFEAALAVEPKLSLALAGRGACWKALGEARTALADYTAALALEPSSPLFLLERGAIRYALGERRGALDDVEAALQIRPHFVQALQFRGEVRRKQNEFADAVADFDAALEIDGRNVPSIAGRGAARRSMGLRMEALEDFDKALALAPRNPAVLAGRGASRLELRMAAAAYEDFQAALTFSPGHQFAIWGSEAATQQLKSAGQQITLKGFCSNQLNAKFIERRRPGYAAHGYPTFWTPDGNYFLYWCQPEGRWKGTKWSDLEKVQNGGKSGFISAPADEDIRLAGKSSGGAWHEFDGASWQLNRQAGIRKTTLLEQNQQTVELSGFRRPEMNGWYVERFDAHHLVNGHETYWSTDGAHFLYYSFKEKRWKGTCAADLTRIKTGANLGNVGAPAGKDMTLPGLVSGWFEWDGGNWVHSATGGVKTVWTATSKRRGVEDIALSNTAEAPRAAAA